jgi:peptidoglycan hydrolase-like protein with peptidoglycan-binding domain
MQSRRGLRARTLVVAAAVAISLPAGVALAASTGGSSSSSASASSSKSQTLQLGSRGKAVKQLQRVLSVDPVSGYYGSETKRAVKRFQKRRGLTADGIAGPATLRALGIRVTQSSYATGGSAPSSTRSSSGSSVNLPPVLRKIAQCESGGNPRAVSRSGRYRGKFQFDQATWEAAGGKGDPAAASEATQDRIALRLYHKRGTAPWPNCA